MGNGMYWGQWSELAARIDCDLLASWKAIESALDGFATAADIRASVHDRSDLDRTDRTLGALVRLAAFDGGGDHDAALLVGHLLAHSARLIASRFRGLSPNIDGLVASELWTQIRTFPWRRRTRAYAKSLLLDTRREVLRDLLPYASRGEGPDRVVLVSPLDWRNIDEHGVPGSAGGFPDGVEVSVEPRLREVLSWAQATGAITAADADLLLDLVMAAERTQGRQRGLNGHAEVAAVAIERGVCAKTIRRHRDRTLAALREISNSYLAVAA
jgi:hypothetical protein